MIASGCSGISTEVPLFSIVTGKLAALVGAALVGAALATSGAVYQTVFRNPLADPYLLGAAAGAGLGATIALTSVGADLRSLLPVFAFFGAISAVLVSLSE